MGRGHSNWYSRMSRLPRRPATGPQSLEPAKLGLKEIAVVVQTGELDRIVGEPFSPSRESSDITLSDWPDAG